MTEEQIPQDNEGKKGMTAPVPAPLSVHAVQKVMPLAPRTLEEAYRCGDAFVLAGMAPDSYLVKEGETINQKATTARVMIGIMKGMEVGYGPATALQVIMIINNKPCLYGDGASALVNASGKIEWQKREVAGEVWGPGYKVTITMKRRDQSEPVSRSFSYEDAQRAKLVTKMGPWLSYPERQCYWRAWSWTARDAASDPLMGLSVA